MAGKTSVSDAAADTVIEVRGSWEAADSEGRAATGVEPDCVGAAHAVAVRQTATIALMTGT
jgi:hypothetical protein